MSQEEKYTLEWQRSFCFSNKQIVHGFCVPWVFQAMMTIPSLDREVLLCSPIRVWWFLLICILIAQLCYLNWLWLHDELPSCLNFVRRKCFTQLDFVMILQSHSSICFCSYFVSSFHDLHACHVPVYVLVVFEFLIFATIVRAYVGESMEIHHWLFWETCFLAQVKIIHHCSR